MTIRKLLYHPVTVAFITVLAVAFYFSLDKSAQKTQSSTQNIRVLEHEIDHASKEVILLEEKIQQTESLQFQEKVVRNELLLQKEGEIVLQIPTPVENNFDNCEGCSTSESTTPLDSWRSILF